MLDPLSLWRAVISDGTGYGRDDRYVLSGREVKKQSGDPDSINWARYRALGKLYCQAAQVADASCYEEAPSTPVAVAYSKEGGRTGILSAKCNTIIKKKDFEVSLRVGEPLVKHLGLVHTRDKGKLFLFENQEVQQYHFARWVRSANRRCHTWSTLRQLSLGTAIGLLITMFSRRSRLIRFSNKSCLALTVAAITFWAYARRRHRDYAQTAGFYFAASESVSRTFPGTHKAGCSELLKLPTDSWARKISYLLRPKAEASAFQAGEKPPTTSWSPSKAKQAREQGGSSTGDHRGAQQTTVHWPPQGQPPPTNPYLYGGGTQSEPRYPNTIRGDIHFPAFESGGAPITPESWTHQWDG